MAKYQPITVGQRFTRLSILDADPSIRNKWGHRFALCVCDCGKTKKISCQSLHNGTSKSCGCLSADLSKERGYRHGNARKGKLSKTYSIWANILQRCQNEKSYAYRYYGARGIKVCERWQVFENFLADMGEKPVGLSIDRIDVNGDYSPENCRWATKAQQASNMRSNRHIEFNGNTQHLTAWARLIGISEPALCIRLKKWPLERALTEPVKPRIMKWRKG